MASNLLPCLRCAPIILFRNDRDKTCFAITELPGQNMIRFSLGLTSGGEERTKQCRNHDQCLFDLLSNAAANATKQWLMRFIDCRLVGAKAADRAT